MLLKYTIYQVIPVHLELRILYLFNLILVMTEPFTSLWIGDVTRMKNGTSAGISQIPLPINGKFKGIDPFYISTGSIAFDSKRNVIWISMLAYGKKRRDNQV
jgi:hypothetical protein